MKKIAAVLLCLCMILGCCACSNADVEDSSHGEAGGNAGTGQQGTAQQFSWTVSGNYDVKTRDDGRLSLLDYDLGVGAHFPDGLEYSNDVIPGTLVISDLGSSYLVVRSVTDEVHAVDNDRSPEKMMRDFFDEYGPRDFEVLYGEANQGIDFEPLEASGSALARASAIVSGKKQDVAVHCVLHSSLCVNGITGYVLKFTYCPVDAKDGSGVWDREGVDTYACDRKQAFGIEGMNSYAVDHRYEVSGTYSLDKTDDGDWKFTDEQKRVGLRFPEELELSNTLIPDAVLVGDENNGYVVARNMTSEYLDYNGGAEDFQRYLLENYLLEDFSTLYDPAVRIGEVRFRYYGVDSDIICTGEARVQTDDFDINVRTDLLTKEVEKGVICYAVLTRYSPYGALGYAEVRNDVRIVYMTPAKG